MTDIVDTITADTITAQGDSQAGSNQAHQIVAQKVDRFVQEQFLAPSYTMLYVLLSLNAVFVIATFLFVS